MSDKPLFDVPVWDGKYRFRTGEHGIEVLLYGEPWLTIERGAKAIIALMGELEEARKRVAELEERLQISPQGDDKIAADMLRHQINSERSILPFLRRLPDQYERGAEVIMRAAMGVAIEAIENGEHLR